MVSVILNPLSIVTVSHGLCYINPSNLSCQILTYKSNYSFQLQMPLCNVLSHVNALAFKLEFHNILSPFCDVLANKLDVMINI